MGQKELIIFIVLITLVLLVFITGSVVFVLQYRRRKIQYEQERILLNQEHQQALIAIQLEVQQQTMQDIGKELHDNVGQKLTLASIYAQSLAHQELNAQTKAQIEEIAKVINDSISDIRYLSKSLVNPEMSQKTLYELLLQEQHHIENIGNVRLHLNITPPDIEIDTNTKNSLYRIIQEFIQNSLKHAHCNDIKVELTEQISHLKLQLSDNGVGFDLNNNSMGIGLGNMKRRATELGVRDFDMRSNNEGTTLNLSINAKKTSL